MYHNPKMILLSVCMIQDISTFWLYMLRIQETTQKTRPMPVLYLQMWMESIQKMRNKVLYQSAMEVLGVMKKELSEAENVNIIKTQIP